MELFHEYKNKYFHLIFRILNLSKDGLHRNEIIKLIEQEEYDEKVIGKDFKTFEGMLLNEYESLDMILNVEGFMYFHLIIKEDVLVQGLIEKMILKF